MELIPKDFIRLSHKLGSDFSLVQGAGGNTSVKIGDAMYVKASGFNLSEALSKDIFVKVPLAQDPLASKFVPQGGLRPSIETSLHLLMPHKYVAHVHSITVIALSVLKDAEAVFSKALADIPFAFIPYTKPGLDLARAVYRGVDKNTPDILILGNHGLVVGAPSPAGIDEALQTVLGRLRHYTPKPQSAGVDVKAVKALAPENYEPVNFAMTQAIALHPQLLAIATSGSLYPDHVVFLGRGAQAMTREALKDQTPTSRLLFIENIGAYLMKGSNATCQDMAGALGEVIAQIPEGADIRYLTSAEEDKLLDWDDEKYRQNLAQN